MTGQIDDPVKVVKQYIRHCERSEAISPYSAIRRPVGRGIRWSASLQEEGDCFGFHPRNDALGDFLQDHQDTEPYENETR